MKLNALIRKDLYVLIKQMRLFLLFILLFSVMPGVNLNIFAIIYSAMLPYTALSYDSHSHWDDLAAMMPYSVRDLVLSKYVLGWLFIAGASALSMLAQLALGPLLRRTADPGLIVIGFSLGAILMALTMPLIFRFGVERGRMLFLLIVCCVAGFFGALPISLSATAAISTVNLLIPLTAAALSAASVLLSVKLYRRQ